MILTARHDPFYVPGPDDYPRDEAWHRKGRKPPLLDPPQADWANDPSRFKLALKTRQAGYSFAEMLGQVTQCAKHPNTVWVNLSRGERQSAELIEKAARHVEAIDAAVHVLEHGVVHAEEMYCESIARTVKILEVRFKNGSLIRGLPANADTARGFSGNVFLDEFAFHPDARAIKAGVIPIVSRGYALHIVSTPNGKSGPFYEMWADAGSGYTKHRVDIYELAHRNVHYRPDIKALRDAMADDELFAQEYECVFLDEATAFVPFELITACESPEASLDGLLDDDGAWFGGCDVGRRRDQTVVWLARRRPDGALLTRRVLTWRNMPFAEQLRALAPIVARCGRFAIDETGLGMMLAEELQREHGARVLPVTFTLASKEDLAVRMKRALEDRRFALPAANFVRSSFHSIKRLPSGGEHFRFDADRSEETGHADAWWAACLCQHAAALPAVKISYRAVLSRMIAGLGRASAPAESLKPPSRAARYSSAAGNRQHGKWGGL